VWSFSGLVDISSSLYTLCDIPVAVVVVHLGIEKEKHFQANQKLSIFLADHGLDNTLRGIDMAFGRTCRMISQLEATKYIGSTVCATIDYEYDCFQ
jgi:sulfopyruvate decarboxylase TPP-binding subunit